MTPEKKRSVLAPLPWLVGSGLLALSLHYVFSDRAGILIARQFSKGLMKELSGKASDEFLDSLFIGMDLMFYLSKTYRRNISNFRANYLFELRNGAATGAKFENGNMKVYPDGLSDWDAKVVFEDCQSLCGYLLSHDQDVLKSLLENKIQIDGNLNLILKFCFMVKDLKRLLGLEP